MFLTHSKSQIQAFKIVLIRICAWHNHMGQSEMYSAHTSRVHACHALLFSLCLVFYNERVLSEAAWCMFKEMTCLSRRSDSGFEPRKKKNNIILSKHMQGVKEIINKTSARCWTRQ